MKLSHLIFFFLIYLVQRIMPYALDGSFEFFMGLMNNPLEMTANLQVSLLSLLMEYIEWRPDSENPLKTPPMMYKHLHSFIKLLIFSPVNGIRDQAYRLAKAAVFSTGAFDRNLHEIGAWLLFLPGYHRNKSSVDSLEVEVLQSLYSIVISFLCDAVSTVGNNLVRYWDLLKNHILGLEGVKGNYFCKFIIFALFKVTSIICLFLFLPVSASGYSYLMWHDIFQMASLFTFGVGNIMQKLTIRIQ